MHISALNSFLDFKKNYLKDKNSEIKIVEIGSQSINESIKNHLDKNHKYTGVDIVKGNNVDIVLDDPYKLPFEEESIDVVISISTFEHTEFFWLSYLEILRILKPTGLFFLNAPSNSKYHRHSTDNWRFYPDSIIALEKWGRKNNFNPKVLEHFTLDHSGREIWCDYVSVTIKDEKFINKYPKRIINQIKNFRNGRTNNSDIILNYTMVPQDMSHWGWALYYKLRKILNKINKKY